MPGPDAESPCSDHKAMSDIDSESKKGYPAAKQNHPKPKHTLKRTRCRSGKPVRDTRPDIISLVTELRQVNIHLRQLLNQQRRREDENAQKMGDNWTSIACSPITSTELFSGSCLLHDKWSSGFDTSISRDLKTYFLAITGAEWHGEISQIIRNQVFKFEGNHIQVDDRLEIIDCFKGRSLGAWDQRALSASETIVQFSKQDPDRDKWKARRNLGELREALEEGWYERLFNARGRVFHLYTRPLSFHDYNFDALVFFEADVAYPNLRYLRVHRDNLDNDGKYDYLYESFEPEDDPRPVIGHVWYVLTILARISNELTTSIKEL